MYFCVFLCSASAAIQHLLLLLPMLSMRELGCLGMYIAIASHTGGFQHCHGTKMAPSGLFPPDQNRPLGSMWQGTFATSKVRLMMSFRDACRDWRPLLNRQLRPCVPRVSTCTAQKRSIQKREWMGWIKRELCWRSEELCILRIDSSIVAFYCQNSTVPLYAMTFRTMISCCIYTVLLVHRKVVLSVCSLASCPSHGNTFISALCCNQAPHGQKYTYNATLMHLARN